MPRQQITPRVTEAAVKGLLATFANKHAGASYVIESFPVLYRTTLHRELKGKFTKGELALMIDAMNGVALMPNLAGQHITSNVEDGIALDGMGKKWEVNQDELIAKLRALSLYQRHCIEVWTRAFWEDGSEDDALIPPERFKSYVDMLL